MNWTWKEIEGTTKKIQIWVRLFPEKKNHQDQKNNIIHYVHDFEKNTRIVRIVYWKI